MGAFEEFIDGLVGIFQREYTQDDFALVSES